MKRIKNYLPYFIQALLFVSSLLPNFGAIDIIAPQWLALSFFGSLGLLWFSFASSNLRLGKAFKIVNIIYLGFIILSCLSILKSENIDSSLITLSQYFTNYIVFLCFVFSFNSITKWKDFFTLLIMVSLTVELVSILTPIYLDIIYSGGIIARSNSYTGLAANINIASFSIVSKLIFIIILLFSNITKSVYKLACWVLLIFSILVLVALSSRGALISLIIIFLFFSVKFIIHQRHKVLLLLGISIFTLFISNKLISNGRTIESRIQSINTKDHSLTSRFNYSNDALLSIKENPFLGIGIGNWKLKSIEFDKYYIRGFIVPYHVHNDFLQIAAESGILASLFYIGLFIIPILIIIKKKSILVFINEYDEIPFVILIFMGIFFIDSMINFPIARPINQLMFNSVIAIFTILMKDE